MRKRSKVTENLPAVYPPGRRQRIKVAVRSLASRNEVLSALEEVLKQAVTIGMPITTTNGDEGGALVIRISGAMAEKQGSVTRFIVRAD